MTPEEKVLAALPATMLQIITKTGMGRTSVHYCLTRMKEAKQVHISAYVPDSRDRVIAAVYTAGKGRNKMRPGAKEPPAERMRRWRLEQKAKQQ